MDERNRQNLNVEEYLQESDVQQRIINNVQRVHSEITITIGRAASLFGFTENQLRDWEDRDLLKPIRLSGGQRHYSYTELEKLAIIRELIDARYAPGEIPAHIDEIWSSATVLKTRQESLPGSTEHFQEQVTIEERLERIRKQAFWRYFVSRTLRLTLGLVCENSVTSAGIVLPLTGHADLTPGLLPKDLSKKGISLIGWSGRDSSFSTFLDAAPSFEYPSDFRVVPLQSSEGSEQAVIALLVVPREMRSLNLSEAVVGTVQRLLTFLCKHLSEWDGAFRQGMQDVTISYTDIYSNAHSPDTILQELAEAVVALGGDRLDGSLRWRYSYILQPQDSILPLHQRSLVVQAKSKNCPFKVGVDSLYPYDSSHSFSLRAFQSGHIVCHPGILEEDASCEADLDENIMCPRIAVPIGGEDGQPLGVLYVVAEPTHAFDKSDQRLLRLLGKMMEELLRVYKVRRQVMHRLTDLIEKPALIDKAFVEFESETQFMYDFEHLLFDIKRRTEEFYPEFATDGSSEADEQLSSSIDDELEKEWVSCVAIDIDNLGRIANKYGDLMVRNLSREVGLRILGQFHASIRKPETYKLYHVSGDRFYILMKGIDDEQSLQDAQRLRDALAGSYHIAGLRSFIEQPTLPDGMAVLSDITVRLAVTSYKYNRLLKILKEFAKGRSDAAAIIEVRKKVSSTLDDVLKLGMDKGGHVVLAWDHPLHRFVAYTAKNATQIVSNVNEGLISV